MSAVYEERDVSRVPKKMSCGDCGKKHRIRTWRRMPLEFGGTLHVTHANCNCGAGVLSWLVEGDADDEEVLAALDAFMAIIQKDKKRS